MKKYFDQIIMWCPPLILVRMKIFVLQNNIGYNVKQNYQDITIMSLVT